MVNQLVQSSFYLNCHLLLSSMGINGKMSLEKTLSCNRILRTILHLDYCTSSKTVLDLNKVPSITDLHALHTFLFVYKYVNSLLPTLFDDLYIYQNDRVVCSTRSDDVFYPLKPRLMPHKTAFFIKGLQLWNSLPCTISNSGTINLFKLRVKAFLWY